MSRPQPCAKSFNRLFKKIAVADAPEPAPEAPANPTEVMVLSFLMWDSTTPRAVTAFKRIRERVVDFNDLRVSMPEEIVEFMGERYPNAYERAQRLRAALRHTFKREHAVSLDRLQSLGKREVRKYLRSLDGVCPYVADRVTLLCFDAHCIPVDDRLRRALAREGVCEEAIDVNELSAWLTRQVKVNEAQRAHQALQAWVDEAGGRTPARAAGGARAAAPPRTKTARA